MQSKDKYGKAAYEAWLAAQGVTENYYDWDDLCNVHPSVANAWRAAGSAVVGLVVSGVAGCLGSIQAESQ